MANIVRIQTGFLSGNLFNEAGYDEVASASKYREALIHALEDAFPEAQIEVIYQRASGVTPYPLQTAVDFDDETDAREEEAIRDEVARISERVFEDYETWVVEDPDEDKQVD